MKYLVRVTYQVRHQVPLSSRTNSGLTMKKFYRFFLLSVVLVTCFTPPVAATGQNNALSHYFLASNQTISEQVAVTIAKQHINGRVLAVNRTDTAYRIKILSDKGTIHILSVNNTDGSIKASN